MKLSNNFSLWEFTKSATAEKKGIDNTPTPEALKNITVLVREVLQPISNHYRKTVSISSGYRSPELNKALGGSTNSQHSKGEAADFEIFGVDNKEVAIWVHENLEFDQLILEFYDDGVTNSGWVHVSFSKENRKEVLLAEKNGKKTVYREISAF